MKHIIALAALLLAGCAVLPPSEMTQPPADWPKLEREVHIASLLEVQPHCGSSAARVIIAWTLLPIPYPRGCAVARFDRMVCVVWRVDDAEVAEHEDAHCEGRDHPGETTLADTWTKFKEKRR